MSSLEHLGDRLGGLFEQAKILYEQDQALRDLCDAHAICVRAVKRSQASRSPALGAEYAAQQLRLEAELRARLQGPRPAAAHSTGEK
jgi:hypothetical protein